MLKSSLSDSLGVRSTSELNPKDFQPINISASSSPNTSYQVFNLLAPGSPTGWFASGGGDTSDKPVWVMFDFGSTIKKLCVKYTFSALGGRMPVDWKLQGDQGDNNWVDLDIHTGESLIGGDSYEYTFPNQTPYQRYRFYCTKSYNGPDNLGLSSLHMFGF